MLIVNGEYLWQHLSPQKGFVIVEVMCQVTE